MHFFIPMLLLPKTPPLTYPNIKEFKGPKRHHFTSLTHSLSLHNQNLRFRSCRRWRSSARADGFSRVKALARTCKTRAGAASRSSQFFKGNSFKFFSKKKMNPEILPQIYREIPLQNFYKEKSL